MSQLDRLIETLKKAHLNPKQYPYVQFIHNPQKLISSLEELQNLVGNNKVKDAIANQTSYLISRQLNKDEPKDDIMLNTILYGPPGVGKTQIGIKLAKIWNAIGYIKKKESTLTESITGYVKNVQNSPPEVVIFILIIVYSILSAVFLKIIAIYNYLGRTLFIILAASLIILAIVIWHYYIKNYKPHPTCREAENPEKCLEKNTDDNEIFTVVSRDSFVDKYLGGTDKKTKKLLEDNLGKVLFIDEAYSLINGHHDPYGVEAVNTLNLFLSEHPNEIIVIFAGYKDLLQKNLFSVQPGLARRCMWHFDCEGYTAEELFQIFNMQLNQSKYYLSHPEIVKNIFIDNSDAFPSAGGDTQRLNNFVKLELSKDLLDNPSMEPNIVFPQHVENGIKILRENNIHKDNNDKVYDEQFMQKMLELMDKNR